MADAFPGGKSAGDDSKSIDEESKVGASSDESKGCNDAPPPPAQVVARVFLSDACTALDTEAVSSVNGVKITHLINLANLLPETPEEIAAFPPGSAARTLRTKRAGRHELQVRCDDTPEAADDLAAAFSEINAFADEAVGDGGGVLFFCFEGKSRSPTALVQYLMERQDMTLLEAVRAVKAVAKPRINAGFAELLNSLERSKRAEPTLQIRVARKPTLSSRRKGK